MLSLLTDPQTYISLLSLTLLEIVLGIDNIIFISILAGKLPEDARQKARVYGLGMALFGRLALLLCLSWLTGLTAPLFTVAGLSFSGKDLVLLAGGLFLIWKSATEIYDKVEGDPHAMMTDQPLRAVSFRSVILQIMLIDVIFSLDSIITAVGLVPHIAIMVVAILVSMLLMMVAAGGIGGFIDRHPSIKVLALSFLLMIGTMLVAEAFEFHIPKGYIYFSLTFALFVEFINIKSRSRHPV